MKVVTCEGYIVEGDFHADCVIVPLQEIKHYEYYETLGREIPIYFREKFERKYFFFKGNTDSELIEFVVWQSQGVF